MGESYLETHVKVSIVNIISQFQTSSLKYVKLWSDVGGISYTLKAKNETSITILHNLIHCNIFSGQSNNKIIVQF